MSDVFPIAALLTPRGRGAVATIAYRGDVAAIDDAGLFHAANGRPLAEQPIDRILFGRWGDDPAEDVVVCRVAVDRCEVHCHGGESAAARLIDQLESLGAHRVSWRDFLATTDGPFAADVAAALAAATTPRTAAIIARQSTGALRTAIERLSVLDVDRHRDEVQELLDRLLNHAEFGTHLTQPWHVVLCGPPNVGKSSLINALVGFERSIVFDLPGTTRDVVTAETAFDGWPLRFSDTAGLRETTAELEAAGIERARSALAAADLRLLVLDRSRPQERSFERDQASLRPDLVVRNKSDLPDVFGGPSNLPDVLDVSAKTGSGVRELLGRIVGRLVPEVPNDVEAVPVSPQQIERIRTAAAALRRQDFTAVRTSIEALSGSP